MKIMAEWISVKDKMPEDGKEVLFYGDGNFMTGFYDVDNECWAVTASDMIAYPEDVTHWMELPECPAEEIHTIDHSADVGKIKTRQEKFLEMFPHADLRNDILSICPGNVDTRLVCNEQGSCRDCLKEYWFAKDDENG